MHQGSLGWPGLCAWLAVKWWKGSCWTARPWLLPTTMPCILRLLCCALPCGNPTICTSHHAPLKPSRYAERLPIGLKSVITGVSAGVVKAFHRRWYQPGNMALVVVGDFPDPGGWGWSGRTGEGGQEVSLMWAFAGCTALWSDVNTPCGPPLVAKPTQCL